MICDIFFASVIFLLFLSDNGVGNVDIKMLKTSRSRALDTGRPIPVYQ